MKRKFEDQLQQPSSSSNGGCCDESSSSSSSTFPPRNKHVKFSSSSSSTNHHDNIQTHEESKHTLQSIREAKSLRMIKQLKGFEQTTSILGQVNETGSGLEGEEGNLNEERFIDEENNNTVMEPFHLEAERTEGIFKDKQTKEEEQRKKKRKNYNNEYWIK
ncbi:hypothetical protein FDP41_007024 [Naegleria fowleri]|uniref:Uncharacterized protein n=1 Tax=Naegleria fowleri TaxID=5763 RepID=A0A6A5BM21_NAEFO|nr:uncharacterized protein FDP41_007024 [Naegleria fowleri]KAF0973939.1 hypothetical protein FDP41_007024 [Naegleria fowleri]